MSDEYIAINTGKALREVAERPQREGRLTVAAQEVAAREAVELLDRQSLAKFRQPSRPLAEWEEECIKGITALGTMRGGALSARVPRSDVTLCYANDSRFRARCDDAMAEYAEGLHAKADEVARGGKGRDADPAMLRFLLAGHMPEKFGKQSTQVVITVNDRKEIERLAREAGIDPAKVIETTAQIINNGKGQNQQ